MRITSKGEVTIPRGIREGAGFLAGAEVEFEHDGRVVRLFEARAPQRGAGRGACGAHARPRRRQMTTDEITTLTRSEAWWLFVGPLGRMDAVGRYPPCAF